jgi:hypothetical protein
MAYYRFLYLVFQVDRVIINYSYEKNATGNEYKKRKPKQNNNAV